MNILDYLTEASMLFISLLFGLFARLFVRVRGLEQTDSAHDTKLEVIDAEIKSIKDISERITFIHTNLEIERVRREDWVPTMSKIIGSLERQSETLARMDERLKQMEVKRSD